MLISSLLPLHDDRVRLRPLQLSDAAPFAEGTKDPEVQEFGHLPEPDYTPDSVRTMIHEHARPGLDRGDLAVLAIARTDTDEFVGSLVLFGVTPDSAEVGFWLHPRWRGFGFATAALDLAAQFAHGSGLASLGARTALQNTASQGVLTRAGFSKVSSTLDTAPSGEQLDVFVYSKPARPREA